MTSRTTTFDVLMATDGRFPGGTTASVVEEIEAQYRAGYRTGLLHLPSPVLGRPRRFAPKLQRILEEGKAELVLGVDRVEAGLLLARHPTVFIDLPHDLPRLEVEHVVLAVNQVAADERGVLPYYDVAHVHRQIERLVGQEATWAPIGPRVRQSLEQHAGSVPLLPWDWENVIDVTSWEVRRDGFVADRPVIGRHSRGHWSKWPDTKRDLLAAYPADPRYRVRILGGTDAPRDILDEIPPNWVDLPFNSVPAREFLATIDFFVYFHHPGLIEAFGRVVLEALSAGAVAIGPDYLKPLFGEACLYGTPADVRRYVDQLYGDWDAYAERSRAGVELARKRFSYETHIERIAKLIGDPSASADSGSVGRRPTAGAVGADGRAGQSRRASDGASEAAPIRATGARTLVVDLRRDTGGADLLPSVVQSAGAAAAPCVAVVPAWRTSEVPERVTTEDRRRGRSRSSRTADTGAEVLVETLPWVLAETSAAERHRYIRYRLDGLLAAHRPERIIVLDSGGRDARVVPDALGDAAARVLLVHRSTLSPPDPSGGRPSRVVQPARADDPEAEHLLQALQAGVPDEWTVSEFGARPRGRGPRRGRAARLRRKAPTWARMWARRTMSTVRRGRVRLLEKVAPTSGLMLFEVDEAELGLPVRAPVTHPAPDRLPIALLVVVGADVDAKQTLRALTERAQMTTAFRPVVLAPPSWVDEAAGYGVTLETVIPAPSWRSAYGGEWNEYLRRRVAETCRVIQPDTVVFTEHTVHPTGVADRAEAAPVQAVLDVMETAQTRRRA
ncbi:glycosyltransferase family 4 protein [Phytoactinopolyspora halotolerans]|uniref:Glycosyltransferase family 4 protein n=1 Tax=Phytoactinopolyspora halotolerans TaxID=1981512 RepID=A0A6L9SJ35_9ACTN|nr:glycosyltransferase family 4 protein [Phytoactinopolyspora halotolerans]NEE04090.1 glycosyltransferase family 4 protein [Phytoactinopolyspora halotolerans]